MSDPKISERVLSTLELPFPLGAATRDRDEISPELTPGLDVSRRCHHPSRPGAYTAAVDAAVRSGSVLLRVTQCSDDLF